MTQEKLIAASRQLRHSETLGYWIYELANQPSEKEDTTNTNTVTAPISTRSNKCPKGEMFLKSPFKCIPIFWPIFIRANICLPWIRAPKLSIVSISAPFPLPKMYNIGNYILTDFHTFGELWICQIQNCDSNSCVHGSDICLPWIRAPKLSIVSISAPFPLLKMYNIGNYILTDFHTFGELWICQIQNCDSNSCVHGSASHCQRTCPLGHSRYHD